MRRKSLPRTCADARVPATVTVAARSEEVRAETLTRREIEAIPDGEYRFEDSLDDDGVDLGRRVKIAVTVRVRGSAMTFDFTGTDPQVKGPINAPLSVTASGIFCGLKMAVDSRSLIPPNSGCWRPIEIVAEPAVTNHCAQVAIRRGHDPYIDREFMRTADAANPSFL